MLRRPSWAAPSAKSGQRAVSGDVVDADDVRLAQGGHAGPRTELLLQPVAGVGKGPDRGRGLDPLVALHRDAGLFAAGDDVDGEFEGALQGVVERRRIAHADGEVGEHLHGLGRGHRLDLDQRPPPVLRVRSVPRALWVTDGT